MSGIAGYKIDGFRTRFVNGATDVFNRDQAGTWAMFCEEYPTEGALSVQIKMGGDTPVIRQWIGDKQFGQFRELNKTLLTLPYEASMALMRREVDGDPSGIINGRIDRFLAGQNYIKDKLVWEKYLTNPTGIDGVALISDTHPYGSASGVWDNKTTDALSFTGYKNAKNQMREIKSENGEQMNLAPTHLFCGPDLERTALEIVGPTRPVTYVTAGAADPTSGTVGGVGVIGNVYAGEVTVVIVNRFSDGGTHDGDWFIMDASKGLKPMGLASFRNPEAITQVAMDSEGRFIKDQYRFSIEADLGPDGVYPFIIVGKHAT
jgi:phage major head subunit gpT-like protein